MKFFIYASNEENALLAETFDEYRDNHRETRKAPVLLICEVGFLWLVHYMKMKLHSYQYVIGPLVRSTIPETPT